MARAVLSRSSLRGSKKTAKTAGKKKQAVLKAAAKPAATADKAEKSKKKQVLAAPVAKKKEAIKAAVPIKQAAPAIDARRKLADRLIEAIEKKKAERGQKPGTPFGARPPGRRGRRPKNLTEYTPENGDQEDSYVFEAENENLEYDTGIRVSSGGDEQGFGMDRSEDFDEELNFDW